MTKSTTARKPSEGRATSRTQPSEQACDAGAQCVRDRILAAAMRLVRTEGLQAMTQARVAADAGVRQSHVTYYYPTRKDLITALTEAIHAQMLQTIDPPLGDGSTLTIAGLKKFVRTTWSEPLIGRLMVSLVVAADEDASVRNWLVSFENSALARTREVFSRLGLHPNERDLRLYQAVVVGASILSLHGGTDAADRKARIISLAFDRLVQASNTRDSKRGATRRVARA